MSPIFKSSLQWVRITPWCWFEVSQCFHKTCQKLKYKRILNRMMYLCMIDVASNKELIDEQVLKRHRMKDHTSKCDNQGKRWRRGACNYMHVLLRRSGEGISSIGHNVVESLALKREINQLMSGRGSPCRHVETIYRGPSEEHKGQMHVGYGQDSLQ